MTVYEEASALWETYEKERRQRTALQYTFVDFLREHELKAKADLYDQSAAKLGEVLWFDPDAVRDGMHAINHAHECLAHGVPEEEVADMTWTKIKKLYRKTGY